MYRKRDIAICLLVFAVAVSSNAAAKPNYSSRFKNDPIARALKKNDVYVGGTQWHRVDIAKLVQLTENNPYGLRVKVAVVSNISADGGLFKSRNSYTRALHKWLKLGDGVLIVVTSHGVSLSTSDLSTSQINSILHHNATLLKTDPNQGVTQIIGSVAAQEQQDAAENVATQQQPYSNPPAQYSGQFGFGINPDRSTSWQDNSPYVKNPVHSNEFWFVILFLVLCPIGFAALLNVTIGSTNRERISGSSIPQLSETPLVTVQQVEQLHKFVIENLAFIDNYLDLLQPSEYAQSARQARDSAAVLDNQGTQLLSHHNDVDIDRAQCLLEQACDYVTACRTAINQATNGTGVAVGLDGTPTGLVPVESETFEAGTDNTMFADIPQNERGACFFCSKPARLAQLTPLNIVVNGQRRKVLACADDVRIVEGGSTPKIRMVEVQGKQVPWYRSPGYDPYRDYYSGAAYYSPITFSNAELHADIVAGTPVRTCNDPVSYPIFVNSSCSSQRVPSASQPVHMNTPPILETGGATASGAISGNAVDVGGASSSGGGTGGVNS